MLHTITDEEIIGALLLPPDIGRANQNKVAYLLSLADAVMSKSQKGDDDDPGGRPYTQSNEAIG